MTNKYEIYKCKTCGNVIEVLHPNEGQLICDNQPMDLLEEKTVDTGAEKHVPIIEELPPNVCREKDGFIVKVGAVAHPMEESHYIEWIEIITDDGKRGKKFLKPGDKPEAEFHTRRKVLGARIYCNVHGLWKSK